MRIRPDAKLIYDLARELFELEEAERQIAEQVRLKRIEFEQAVKGSAPEQLQLPLRPRGSCPARLREIFSASPNETIPFHALLDRLSDVQADTVRANVSKLIATREIERAGPGLLRARPRDDAQQELKLKGGAG